VRQLVHIESLVKARNFPKERTGRKKRNKELTPENATFFHIQKINELQ